MQAFVSKQEWVSMFRDSGLDDATMDKWHHLFETRHPQAHQAFLELLEISPEEISSIRARYS